MCFDEAKNGDRSRFALAGPERGDFEALLMPGKGAGPVPLLLGVTGHRDLRVEDLARLRDAIASILTSYQARLPHTRIIVLSSLADGADRLVAKAALELGCELFVPLPFSVDEFKKTLADDAGRIEFDELAAQAVVVFEVPRLNPLTDWKRASADVRYANCGAYIALHCSELLALWDGNETDHLAGTAKDVSCKLEGAPESLVGERSELDPDLTGPVIQIVTPRRGTPEPGGVPFRVQRLYPRFVGASEDRAKPFEELLRHLEDFNKDAQKYGKTAQTEHPSAEQMRAITGNVAAAYQRRTIFALIAILFSVFSAALLFNLYIHDIVRTPAALIAYVLLTLVAFGIYQYTHRKGWQDRYQDYRCLSGALRVSVFWQRACVDARVADEVARLQRGEIDWLPAALRSSVPMEVDDCETPQVHFALRDVYENWVSDQEVWYGERINVKRSHVASTTVLISALLVLGVCFAVVGGLVPADTLIRRVSFLASGMTAVTAALTQFYRERRSWSEELKEYLRVRALFKRAAEQLAPLLKASEIDRSSLRRAQRLLQDLGLEALRENIAWRNLHRQRPIRIPHT